MKKLLLICFSLLFLGVSYGQDEIWMHPNRGQWHENISYKIGIPSGKLFLEKQGFTYSFSDEGKHYDHGHDHDHEENDASRYHVVKTHFLGSNPDAPFEEISPSPFYENYFLGNDTTKWKHHITAYNEIKYLALYNQIDLHIYQSNATLKYDYIIDVGGDPNEIKVQYEGQDDIRIENGALVVTTSLGEFSESKPFAYQQIGMLKQRIECEYLLEGNIVSLIFPDGYDTDLPLIIDPELSFSTFTGASSDNWGMTACPDINGRLIGAGIVFGDGYPTSAGAYDGSFNGGAVDIGITKFNSDGSGILFSTFIGGNGSETPHSLVVNDDNQLYIMGATSSDNFPVGGSAYQNVNNGGGSAIIDGINFLGGSDIFIIKLTPNGDGFLGGTFYGGNGFDGISEGGTAEASMTVAYNYGDQLRGEIILDDASNVYIASTTRSSNLDIVGGFDGSLAGAQDAVVAKFNPNLSNLLWSTYLGGSNLETGNSIQVSSTGDIFVAGGTSSTNFPNTAGNIHSSYKGGTVDGYVMKFPAPSYASPEGTYLGTNTYDQAYFVQLDADDFVYVYGQSSGPYQTDGSNYINSNSGQFIHKISNDLNTTIWSSVFGAGTGNAEISPTAFLVSDCYEIYIAGWGGNTNIKPGSTTTGFPVTADAYQTTTSGSNFYLAVFSADMEDLKYGTFMGDPSSNGDHVDGGTSRFDKSGTIYHAVCAACGPNDFPTTPGTFSEANGSSNCNMAAFQFELSKIDAVLSTGAPVVCIPDPVTFANDSENGNTYFWDFGDGIGTSTDFEPTYFYTIPGDYTVMLVVSDADGCYTPDTAYIDITIALFEGEAGTLIDTICPGSSVELFAIGGESYTWGPADVLDDPNSSNPIATITEETTFTVIISSECGTSEVDVTVYVHGTDAAAEGDTIICVGGNAMLSSGGGVDYDWSPEAYLDDPGSSNPTATPPITTYFTVLITTEEGCEIEDLVKVQVDQDLPYPNLIDEVNICNGDSIRVTASGGREYLWVPDYYVSDDTLYNPYLSPPVDTSYLVKFTNACGSTFDSVYVNVIDIDADISTDTTICPDDSAQLWATGGEFYKWIPNSFLDNPTIHNPVTTPQYDITYTVIVSDEFGCSSTATTTITLFDRPDILVSPAAYPIVGDTISIYAEGDGTILWTPPYNISCETCPTTVVYPEIETFYTATITDDNGCKNKGVVPVYFDPLIFVPNAFTPDTDVFNNYFKAIAHNISNFEMLIFNRWGEVIYTMNNIDETWDGTYQGVFAPDDVYIWQIVYTDLKGLSHEMRGHVTLLR